MYVDVCGGKQVNVRYIPTHTGHKPTANELKFLPLPDSTKKQSSTKAISGSSMQEDTTGYTVCSCTHAL